MCFTKAVLLVSVLLSGAVFADGAPERRRDQFPTEDAYLVVPLPYSYPGIGEGFFLLGNISNILNSTTDMVLVEVTGDATGRVIQFDEVPLLSDKLFLSLALQNINRAAINQYAIRGMDGSDGSDYTIFDVTQADQTSLRIDYTLDDRRFNYYISRTSAENTVAAVLNPDGSLIKTLGAAYTAKNSNNTIGLSVDLTDDYLDPRKGFRFGIDYTDQPAKGADDPDYYVINYNLLFYKPFRKADTLVVNYFQSDAHVRSIGNINPSDIRAELGLDCGADPACLQTEQKLVNSFVDARTYGTAVALGGLERLRSYPRGRFAGGHAAFFGAEYRWNLTEEATPFNYFFWKDVRTGKQIAFFTEAGSVSERSSELWDERRYTYGVGFRLLAASGSVYRADFSYGSEGAEIAVFFFYPW